MWHLPSTTPSWGRGRRSGTPLFGGYPSLAQMMLPGGTVRQDLQDAAKCEVVTLDDRVFPGMEENHEDPIEELAAEVAAAAERAELDRRGDQILDEHEEEQVRQLAELRAQRSEELYDWTISVLRALKRASQDSLDYVRASSIEPGRRPLVVRWKRVPRRQILLDFNRHQGTIRVLQQTHVDGADIGGGGRLSREIDAADKRAEAEVERALRWLWHHQAEAHP
jgi:hypothetical protein